MKKIILINIFLTIICGYSFAQMGEWTWMHGPQNQNNPLGNYGVKGVSSTNNIPPVRYEAAYWKDGAGNFWVFGGSDGSSASNFNDMWRFNPKTIEWTWVHGPQYQTNTTGNYGTMGVSSPLNIPSARGWGSNCWTGDDGYLYLFGGSGNNGNLNDLWRYDIQTNEWTWIHGSQQANIQPNYGIKGISDPNNDPGGRNECKSGYTIDNELWLFGGTHIYPYNDLWKFDLNNMQWTWISGSNVQNSTGNFGTLGVGDPMVEPPARMSFTKWQSRKNDLFVFAGLDNISIQNNIFKYEIDKNQWTWLGGSSSANPTGNSVGNCISDIRNIPAPRFENQTVESNSLCNTAFWSFGGNKVLSWII